MDGYDRITIMGLDLVDVIHIIRQYQLRGVDVYEVSRLRLALEEEKRKMEELTDRIKELLGTL